MDVKKLVALGGGGEARYCEGEATEVDGLDADAREDANDATGAALPNGDDGTPIGRLSCLLRPASRRLEEVDSGASWRLSGGAQGINVGSQGFCNGSGGAIRMDVWPT